jgi:hypothetical protein
MMMAAGLVLMGCEQGNCPRTADCRSQLNSAGENDSYAKHCSDDDCNVVKYSDGKGIKCDC